MKEPRFLGRAVQTLCMAALLLLALPCPARPLDQTVTIAVDAWAPYLEKEDPTKGMASELVASAFAAVGMKVELVFVPWARALDGVRHGKYDASYPWLITPERQTFAWFSHPFMGFRYVFFYRRDRHENVTYETLEDLHNYSIVGMLGYYYEQLFSAAHLNVDYKLNGDIAFRMLEAGRTDLLAEDEVVGWHRLKKDYPHALDIFAATRPYTVRPGHLIVSKLNPEGQAIVEAFDRGLQVLHESGEYERIVSRYQDTGALEP